MDREVEDSLIDAGNLVGLEGETNPTVVKLMATVKRLSGTVVRVSAENAKQKKMINSLNRLVLANEAEIQSHKACSAEDIATELSPALKKGLEQIKKEIKKEVVEEMELVKNAVGESRVILSQQVAVLNSAVTFMKASQSVAMGKLTDIINLNQSSMGAAMLINDNLVASGIVKGDPASQVNIPGLLLEINAKMNDEGSSSLAYNPNLGALESSNVLTPRHLSTPSSVLKPSRWGGQVTPGSVGAVTPGNSSAPRIKPKALSAGAQGNSATPNQGLHKEMMKGRNLMSQSQIDRKLEVFGNNTPAQKRARRE